MPTKSKRAYHHGNLRPALLEAALELILEVGPQSFTLREVARRARVSHAAPYRHVADKDALLAERAAEGFRLLGEATTLDPAATDPARAFQATGAGYLRFAIEHPAHYRLMFGDAIADPRAHPDLATHGDHAFQILLDSITMCQGAGLVRAGDPMELAIATWSMVHGLASLIIDGRLREVIDARGPDAVIESVTATLMTGLIRR
ncbi:MAG TPA: WHG domain-containing protein [Kofleriaceae bacterium]|nr:WHG domain-containing protein [Kofleriaceae bacterium]